MTRQPQSFAMYRVVIKVLCWMLLAWGLWTLRSWNLDIGDGRFCCKQTVAEHIYDVTLSRNPLSYLLYRSLFFTLSPILNWWVEDIIALSSCAAGMVYFWALYSLSRLSARTCFERWAILLFPSTTMLLQVFCGHVEFYSWTCALLAVSAYASWRSIHQGLSVAYPSACMALAAAFHSSAVFYYPALLLLPLLQKSSPAALQFNQQEVGQVLLFLFLFLGTALLHRSPMIYLGVIILAVPAYYFGLSDRARAALKPGLPVFLPWFFLFTMRAAYGLRAEPLLEPLPPFREPYDHGAFLYMALSWDHFYDKLMFHFWLAPFALPTLILLGISARRTILSSRWLVFLLHYCFWTLLWSTLFYPQLRTNDWDLFASISISLNLFAAYTLVRVMTPRFKRVLLTGMILTHLVITLPIILSNSSLLEGRGYAVLQYQSQPEPATAYLRGLPLGVTTLEQRNVRSGPAVVRMIPLDRRYLSWAEGLDIEAGSVYHFDVTLRPRPEP